LSCRKGADVALSLRAAHCINRTTPASSMTAVSTYRTICATKKLRASGSGDSSAMRGAFHSSSQIRRARNHTSRSLKFPDLAPNRLLPFSRRGERTKDAQLRIVNRTHGIFLPIAASRTLATPQPIAKPNPWMPQVSSSLSMAIAKSSAFPG
jgi:hypothetical protein